MGLWLDLEAGTMHVRLNGVVMDQVFTEITGPVHPVFNVDNEGECLELMCVNLNI